MIRKTYKQEGNAYIEDGSGMCKGVEFTKENGNVYRSVSVNFPTFDQSLELASALYHVYIKAVGDDVFLLRETCLKTFKGNAFYVGNPSLPTFGTPCEKEAEGAMPDVVFLSKVFYGEYESIKMSDLIYGTLEYLLLKYL